MVGKNEKNPSHLSVDIFILSDKNKSKMIVCVVCQTSSSLPSSNVSFKEISSEKSKHSNTILALKLFACLHLQLLSGYLCSVCHHLIDEIDGFETQIKSLKDVLTSKLHSKNVSNDLGIDLSAISDEERDICSNEEDLKETEGEDGSETGLGIQSKQSSTEFWNNANNPEALKRYVDSGRVDTCFTLTTTQRGEDLLMYQGYAYRYISNVSTKRHQRMKSKCSCNFSDFKMVLLMPLVKLN